MRSALLSVFFSALCFASPIGAEEPTPLPASLYGQLTVGGAPAPVGTEVSAWIGGERFAESVAISVGAETHFRLDVPADLPATGVLEGGQEGQIVEVRVGNAASGSMAVWTEGTYERLDLAAPEGPDLTVEVDDSVSTVAGGERLTYTVTVNNAGALDATGVAVVLGLSEFAAFVSATDGGSENAGAEGTEVRWPAFALAAGATATRTATVEVTSAFPASADSFTGTATVTDDGSQGLDPVPADNQATDSNSIEASPDLVVTKDDGLGSIAPGTSFAYTVTVANVGSREAIGVELVDVLPEHVTFFTASDEGFESAAGTLSWPAFELAAGATVTRTIQLRFDLDPPPTLTQLVNTAGATPANGPDPNPADNTGTDLTAVAREADLGVVSVSTTGTTVDPQTLALSGQVAMEIENRGNSDLSIPFQVTIFEDLDLDGAFTAGVDTVLGVETFSDLLPSSAVALFEVPVSGTMSFRDNRLFTFVDSAEEIAELDETDNIAHSGRCEAAPTPGVFQPVVEWSWPPSDVEIEEPLSKESLSTPLVVQLTDDNGDGRIDGDDTPDVVFVTANLGNPLDLRVRMRAIRGDSGLPLWTITPRFSSFEVFSLSGLAAGDIDGDGMVEILTTTVFGGAPNKVVAYEHTGRYKWSSDGYSTHLDGATLTNRDNPTIADLNGDGRPEILVGANVFDNTGRKLWTGSGGQGYQSASNRDEVDSGAISIVANLDLAGDPEVVTGNTAYRSDGSLYWQVPHDDGYTAVANFDGDDFPEIVVVARGRVRLHEHDGTLIWGPVDLPGAGAEAGGAPTVADFDGDGEPEIGVAGSTLYSVFEGDGSVKWQANVQDGSSNMTGSTVFDLDGDGRFEVIYRDEEALRVYRGEDGTVLFEDAVSSFTQNEQPVVADVDGDGRAEIVVTSDQATQLGGIPERTFGVRVYGDSFDNWVPARKIWNQHAYSVGNVTDDGGIPTAAADSWLIHNTFRAQLPPDPNIAFAAPDLSASRLVVDLDAFPTIKVTGRVGNGGAADAPAGIPVAFYDADPAAGGVPLGTVALPMALSPGQFRDVDLEFDLSGLGDFAVWMAADDDGTGQGRRSECDESNNRHGRPFDTSGVGLWLQMDDGVAAVRPEETFVYTLTVANAGPFERTGIALTAEVPPNTTVVEVSGGGTVAGNTIAWPTFTLSGGGVAVRTLTLQVDPAIPLTVKQLTTTATVADDGTAGPDTTPGNNSAADINAVLTVRADIGGPYSGEEGSEILFDASSSSDRDGTITAYAWDLDEDGAFDDAFGAVVSRSFPDDGLFPVAVQVTDDTGETDTASTQVTVTNAAPAVTAPAEASLVEGGRLSLDGGSFTDPGTADSHTATVDWGDGAVESVPAAGGAVTAAHTYADDGAFPITVCVTDDDGGEGCAVFVATVANSDPVVTAEGDVDLAGWRTEDYRSDGGNWVVAADGLSVRQTANGAPSVFYGEVPATGADLTGTVRVGGATNDNDYFGFALGYRPGDNDNAEAEWLLIDWRRSRDVGFNPDPCTGLTVVEPELLLSRVVGVPDVGEFWWHTDGDCNGPEHRVEVLARGLTRGATGWAVETDYTFRIRTQPDRLQVWVNGTLEFDVEGNFDFGGGRFGFFNYSQDFVTYRAFNAQGVGVLEGEPVALAASFGDAGLADTHQAEIDWLDGTVEAGVVVAEAGGGRVIGEHVYGDDGLFPVAICVTDDDGGQGCGTVEVTAVNQPPVLVVEDFPIGLTDSSGIEVTAAFTDAGLLDTHAATIDWGDGTVESATVEETAGEGTVRGLHTYAEIGEYPVEICVTDDDGGESCEGITAAWADPRLDLAVEVGAESDVALPGAAMRMRLLADNRGTVAGEGTSLTAALPVGLAVVNAGGGTYDTEAHTVTWDLGTLPYRGLEARSLELRVEAAVALGSVLETVVTLSDDGTSGYPEAEPANNQARHRLTVQGAGTPIVLARVRNLAVRGLVVDPEMTYVASSFTPAYPPEQGSDLSIATLWLTECSDAANLGADPEEYPWWEMQLPRDATVRRLQIFGNWFVGLRDHDVLEGVFELFDERDRLLWSSGPRALPAPRRDLVFNIPTTPGVRRVRFTLTADQGCAPGFSDLRVFGYFGHPEEPVTVLEGTETTLDALFFDPDSSSHGAAVDWGDGTLESGAVNQAADTVTARHSYLDETPDRTGAEVEVCVTDSSGKTGCDTYRITSTNAPPVVQDDGDLDLRRWTAETYPSTTAPEPDWQIEPDGTSVFQTVNSAPGLLYGDFPAQGTTLEGTLRVETETDNDYIGFALGFEAGDTANAEAEYILVDWRKSPDDLEAPAPCSGLVTTGPGFFVSRVRGVPLPEEFWFHINDDCNGQGTGVDVLARGNRFAETGWQSFTDYHFRFEYSATRLRVWVDGVLEAEVEGNFPDGGFAFYNYSQQEVRYTGFGLEAFNGFEGTPFTLRARFVDPGPLDTHTGTIAWGDGTQTDAAIEPGTAQDFAVGTHTYGDDGTFGTEVCVTDNDGATDCGALPVVLENLPPVVAAVAPFEAVLEEPFPYSAPFTDPGFRDVHTATVDWGDGTVGPAVIAEANGIGTAAASHAYAAVGTYTVTVCVTDDEGATACAAGQATVVDLPDTPVSVGDATAQEGDGVLTFPVTLAEASRRPITVTYQTEPGTATVGEDYLSAEGTLTLAPGEVEAEIPVEVLDDDLDEAGDETLTVRLTTVEGGLLEDGEALGTLKDDDTARLSLEGVTVEEGDSGTTEALFTLRASNPADRPFVVHFATAESTDPTDLGAATSDRDFLATEGVVTLEAGETTLTIAVEVVGDLLLEADEETFLLRLTEAETEIGAEIEVGEAVGTILDDEVCSGPELVTNPGAETTLGEEWLPQEGTWSRRFAEPAAAAGDAYFAAADSTGAPDTGLAELVQGIDVFAFATRIDTGEQDFAFQAQVRTAEENPSDIARIVLEYRTVDGTLLDAFDSGEIASPSEWRAVEDTRPAPVGTRQVHLRLLATRFAEPGTDGYFDALSLRSLRTAVLTTAGVEVREGDGEPVEALFRLSLSCAVEGDVQVVFSTVEGTALAKDDYLPNAGTVTFPEGETTAIVPVTILGDEIHERHEDFFLNLTTEEHIVLLPANAVGTIRNDDFCARSPGFWKTHREVWPVESLRIGAVELDAEEMTALLETKGPDAANHLARQLVATKLNLLVGSDPGILPTVEAADAFLTEHPPGSNPRANARQEANGLKDVLDGYNNLDCEEVPVLP